MDLYATAFHTAVYAILQYVDENNQRAKNSQIYISTDLMDSQAELGIFKTF